MSELYLVSMEVHTETILHQSMPLFLLAQTKLQLYCKPDMACPYCVFLDAIDKQSCYCPVLSVNLASSEPRDSHGNL